MSAVKICGVTSVDDARRCVDAGVDALGLNFYAGSPRCCEPEAARAIVEAVGEHVLTVGVFVDAPLEEIRRTQEAAGFACIQLHGAEPPELLEPLLPHAYKAVRVRGHDAVAETRRYGGEYVLLDAYVPGTPGGTGARFDWSVARIVAQERKLALAGGLTPENVAQAVEQVRPFCVDTASGVESAPGRKDAQKVHAFVRAARAAWATLPTPSG